MFILFIGNIGNKMHLALVSIELFCYQFKKTFGNIGYNVDFKGFFVFLSILPIFDGYGLVCDFEKWYNLNIAL